MKFFFTLFLLIILQSCNKPKSVYICGDHICVNKEEARKYFEENLSLEVKILRNKKEEESDLIELNLKKNNNTKTISLLSKDKTDNKLKDLSKEEIKKIKDNLKNKEKENKKYNTNKSRTDKSKTEMTNKINKKRTLLRKNEKEIVDICKILKKCDFEEISKYLIKQGKKKNFPDITLRE